MTKDQIIKKITNSLIDGGYQSIYDFVESHINKKDIEKYDNEGFINNHGTYPILSEDELVNVVSEENCNIITDVFDLKIGKTIYKNSIASTSKILDLYKNFCERNKYKSGNLYIVKLNESSYYTITDYYSDDILEEFIKYCEHNDIDLCNRDFEDF